ncbi:MAG: TlpA family protein disulfide reductase [Kangiellaceae bacterium]|nr:TlpA family protein disulfide reductase [Kangiellaceae bacterium]
MNKSTTLLFFFALLTLIFSSSNKAEESTFDLSSYQGKVVYLDFWASWCIPCRKSFPWMNKIQQQFGDDLVIIAINLDKEKNLATEFLQQYNADFEIKYDPKGKIAKQFKIKGMPSSVLFDRNGKAVVAHTGFYSKKITQYEQELQQLLLLSVPSSAEPQ